MREPMHFGWIRECHNVFIFAAHGMEELSGLNMKSEGNYEKPVSFW